ELVASFRELLSKGHSAAGPRLEGRDALPAPGAGAPPENGGCCEGDEAGGRENDRLEIPPELRLASRERYPDEGEELHLEQQDEEREGERCGAVRTPAAVGKGDVDEAAHAARMLEEGRRALGSNADHSDRSAD